MDKYIGKTFTIVTDNVMTVTSMRSKGVEQYKIVDYAGDGFFDCELIGTNRYMYSGSGNFKQFAKSEIILDNDR